MKRFLCGILTVFVGLQMLACGTYTVTVPEGFIEDISEDVMDVAGSILENVKEEETGDIMKYGPVAVKEDEPFGGILIQATAEEFKEKGFLEGDSVDITFSNGYRVLDIPFYSGYYGKSQTPVLVAYPGLEFLSCNLVNGTIWEKSGLSEEDQAVIELRQKGKYLTTENAFHLSYNMEKGPDESDESFANFRSPDCPTLKEGLIYRSASPCDDSYNRVAAVDALLEKAGINYVIDLADGEEELLQNLENGNISDYYREIIASGKYVSVKLGTPGSEDYGTGIVEALRGMLSEDGPFLIHCMEGKDRTGFVCALLEALSGASYDQILRDYMKTYENYYGITKKGTPDLYEAVLETYFLPIIETVEDAESAEEYLLSSGMEAGEVEALKEKISK